MDLVGVSIDIGFSVTLTCLQDISSTSGWIETNLRDIILGHDEDLIRFW